MLRTPDIALARLAEWDVDFKLHAPYNTVVEGRYAGGKL